MPASPYDPTDEPQSTAQEAHDRVATACVAYAYSRRLETGDPERVITLALQTDFPTLAVSRDPSVRNLLNYPGSPLRDLLGLRTPTPIPRP